MQSFFPILKTTEIVFRGVEYIVSIDADVEVLQIIIEEKLHYK